MSEKKILHAIVFKDENGKECLSGTNGDGYPVRIIMCDKFALPVGTDVYYMREAAEAMASNRLNSYRIIEVEEIIKPVVVGYREIESE